MTEDPLDQVFVKTEEVAGEQRALLAQIILRYASIISGTGEVHFKPTFDDLGAKQKILLYLLCRLAIATRPNTTFTVAVTPTELEKITMKSGDGYSVPAMNLQRAKKLFSIDE